MNPALGMLGSRFVANWDAQDRSTKVALLGLTLIAAAGSFLVVYATRWGPWAGSDSVEYLVSARNLLAGQRLGLYTASGQFQPLSLHPPLYSLVLASLGMFGSSLVSVARWLNVLLFWVTTMALGLGTFRLTRSAASSLGCALVFVSLPSTLGLFTGAMSEPLFLLLGLVSLLWLLSFLERREPKHLVASGACAGLATLARLPGLALLPAGILGLLTFDRGTPRQKLYRAFLFLGLGLLPAIIWLVWLAAQPDSAGPRQWVRPEGNLWFQLNDFRVTLVQSVWGWIPFASSLPPVAYRWKLGLVVAMAAVGVVVSGAAIKQLARSRSIHWTNLVQARAGVLLIAIVASYVGQLALTWLFTLPPLETGDLDDRILYPLRLLLVVAGFYVLRLWAEAWGRSYLATLGSLLLAAAFLWNSTPASLAFAKSLHRDGAGYTSTRWRGSKLIAFLQQLPTGQAIVTNESAAVLFLLERPAYDIPELMLREKLDRFTRFGDGGSYADGLFQRCEAVLALFDSGYWQFYEIYGEATDERWPLFTDGLALAHDAWDGGLYVYDTSEDARVICGDPLSRLLPQSKRGGIGDTA